MTVSTSPMPALSSKIHEVLRKNWGYSEFRPLQEDIILSVLSGKDTLGLMPTGGGKSITFQVPGLCYDSGLTIVVTPLISLMKDQVDNLKRHRIKAAAIYFGMSAKEIRMSWELITNGRARFLYVSPEKLQNERFLIELRNLKINLITVDEAHCISQWGYDFRPSYLNINRLRKILPGVPVLALTATATPLVAKDIMKQLDFQEENIFRKSFSRDNISYLVRNSDTKIHETLRILSRTEGSSIVYVRSRKRTKEISDYLNSAGISSTFYHAGLDNQIKAERQTEWKQGTVRVIVATNAFGMGIDKPDVRVVVHYDIPPTLEEYYQEAGRAGRDGLPSYAVLLTSKSDQGLLRRRVTEAFPERPFIKDTYEKICNNLHVSVGEGYEMVREFNIVRFCNLFGIQEKQCRAALRLLGQADYMHFSDEAEKRSRMKILCKREDLYDIRYQGKNDEKVLAMALRLYTGLFSDFIYIRETEISWNLRMSQTDVYEALISLDKQKILSYIPKSGLPLIYFPTAREEKTSLIIGKNIYEERKALMMERVDSIIDYAFNGGDCRVERMLAYFGETNAGKCGKCDSCREKKQKKEPQKKKENALQAIISFLGKHPEGARYISIESQCGGDKESLTSALSLLCNEGYIKYSEERYYLN